MEEFLLKGILLGFAIAAPVGPIGVLCIRRTLQFGRWSGLFSGLGAAFADTLYGIVAAYGLTLISDFLLSKQLWLHLIGGAFLLYLGAKTFFAKTRENNVEVTHKTLIGDFFSTFFLTMTNPMTILSYVAIFAALGLTDVEDTKTDSFYLVLGVFVGSSLWWLILSEGVTLFRKRLSNRVMVWINRIAGLLITAFGIAAWVTMAWKIS
jgi:threonine/homoserine/homoserine lactone efflux protein